MVISKEYINGIWRRITLIAVFTHAPGTALAETAASLNLAAHHRLRFESLQHSPRPDAPASDELLVSRLNVSADWRSGQWSARAEVQDARAWQHGPSTPLGTDDVNTLEPIEAWLGWQPSPQLTLRAGRMTQEWHTRRLLARNRFRNTTNSFEGLDANWSGEALSANAFVLQPLTRLPNDPQALRGNDFALDHSSSRARLYGLNLGPTGSDDALYLLHLDAFNATQITPRRLTTLGGQRYQTFASGRWHAAAEVALQFGDSRAQDSPSGARLAHRAGFLHAELGRHWTTPFLTEARYSFDYASGDKNTSDQRQERFDTLFGARRFEYGPSGILGTAVRSNLISQELRLIGRPNERMEWMAAWRGFWLAQSAGRIVSLDTQSQSEADRHLGQQIEARLRFRWPEGLEIEAGAAYLHKGSAIQGPGFNNPDEPAIYTYLTSTLRW